MEKEENSKVTQAIEQALEERAEQAKQRHRVLVIGVWVYFFLLIFEGGLRRWVFPSLATPLLIVRDPVAIGLMLYAWYYNMFPRSPYVVWMFGIAIISSFTSLFLGHGNLMVTIYGARLFMVHFPFIFLMGAVLDRNDVLKFGRVVLMIAIPMALLIAVQFYSPQSAWVNRGVGGDISGAGFGGAMGYFRPPGTFSFTNGTTAFFSLAAAYIFYFWLRPGQINKTILIAATLGLIIAIPFSISRMLTFTMVVMFFFIFMTVTRNPRMLGKILGGAIGIGVLVVVLSATDVLTTPIEVITARFEGAGRSEGGNIEGTLGNRYIGGMVYAISSSGKRPFFGEGLGMGSNVGASLLGRYGEFLISEEEWGRVIGEMGALLGLMVIAIRLIISVKLAWASYNKIRYGDLLPWMLLSFMLLIFPQGVWAHPTILGFSTMITGLLLASFNDPKEEPEAVPVLS